MDLKIVSVCVVLLGCGPKINNPAATLREKGRPASVQLQAMDMLDDGLERTRMTPEKLH